MVRPTDIDMFGSPGYRSAGGAYQGGGLYGGQRLRRSIRNNNTNPYSAGGTEEGNYQPQPNLNLTQ